MFLFAGLCRERCPQGYYFVNRTVTVPNYTLGINSVSYSHQTCEHCSFPCTSCIGPSQTSCTSCQAGYILSNGMCIVDSETVEDEDYYSIVTSATAVHWNHVSWYNTDYMMILLPILLCLGIILVVVTIFTAFQSNRRCRLCSAKGLPVMTTVLLADGRQCCVSTTMSNSSDSTVDSRPESADQLNALLHTRTCEFDLNCKNSHV